jgi:phage-related protein
MAAIWTWCPMRGVGISTAMRINEVIGIDGYTDRRTRGINPATHSWDLSFPFTAIADHQAMNDFLSVNCLDGFNFLPPGQTTAVFVTCDTWSSTVIARARDGSMVGEFQATFVQSFTPQESG